MKTKLNILYSALLLTTIAPFTASALTIRGERKGANAASSPLHIESFSEKGYYLNQSVKFGNDGTFTIELPAREARLYWISGTPLFLAPDDVISISLPEQKVHVIGSSATPTTTVTLVSSTGAQTGLSVSGNERNTLLMELQKNWKTFTAAHFMDSTANMPALIDQQDALTQTMIAAAKGEAALTKMATYYSRAFSLMTRRSFAYYKKGTVLPAKFYQLLDDMSLDNPLINQFDPLMLGNMTMAYTGLYLHRKGIEDHNDFERNHFIFSTVHNYRVVNEQASQSLLRYISRSGLDQDAIDLLPLAKEKTTDSALLSKINAIENEQKSLLRNAPAPSFTLNDRNNALVNLADYKGKVVAIDVWATWCSACVKELPNFLKLREAYAGNDNIVFITVSTDGNNSEKAWTNYLQKKNMNGIDLITLGEKGQAFRNAYSIIGIPRYLIIDKQGKIVVSYGPKPSSTEYQDMLKAELAK